MYLIIDNTNTKQNLFIGSSTYKISLAIDREGLEKTINFFKEKLEMLINKEKRYILEDTSLYCHVNNGGTTLTISEGFLKIDTGHLGTTNVTYIDYLTIEELKNFIKTLEDGLSTVDIFDNQLYKTYCKVSVDEE